MARITCCYSKQQSDGGSVTTQTDRAEPALPRTADRLDTHGAWDTRRRHWRGRIYVGFVARGGEGGGGAGGGALSLNHVGHVAWVVGG